jgi:tetratricopeptide (TPR) repeat protein
VAIFIACTLLAPALVTVRNAVVAHDPVFIASQGGVNLFVGNHDGVDGFTPTTPTHYEYDGSYQDAIELYGQRAAEDAQHRRLKASEVNTYWTDRAIAWMRMHPATSLALALKKFVLMWSHREIRDNVAFDYVRRDWTPILWLTGIGFWLVGPLGLAGMAALGVVPRCETTDERDVTSIRRLLYAYVLVTMTSFILFFAAERFRLPVVPVLLLLTGWAITEFADFARRGHRPEAWAIIAALVAGCLLVNVDWYKTDSNSIQALDYWSCGNRYVALKHFDDAEKQYLIAAKLDPLNADIRLNLGTAYYYQGNPAKAMVEWRNANRIRPSAGAYYDIATAEKMLGQADDARRDLLNAIHIAPGYRRAIEALRDIGRGQ